MTEKFRLKRHPANPILSPDPDRVWESGAVFNCGATVADDGRVYLLYRAIPQGYRLNLSGRGYDNYISSVGCAVSEDGVRFRRFEEPVLKPDDHFDRFGCEDPRVTRLQFDGDTRYLITYTALSAPAFSGYGNRVALASTGDFRTFRKHGVIIPDVNDKDAVFFPEPVGGRIALLHRIMPDIQIVYFEDFEQILNPPEGFWPRYLERLDEYTVMRPRPGWESAKIGAGPPPIKTGEGWLLIYHGVDENHVYRAGAALLDLDDPRRVIARSPYPILEPMEPYEREGDVPNVVFPEGAIVVDGDLYVYYGGADKVCCLATASLSELVDWLLSEGKGRASV